MRIGVVPVLNHSGGGHYQYSLTMLDALSKLRGDDDFIIFADEIEDESLQDWRDKGWRIFPVKPFSLKRTAKVALRRMIGQERIFGLWTRYRSIQTPPETDIITSQPRIGRWFRRKGAQLMIYPSANPLAFEAGVPYIMAIHDLQHLLQPEFPENSEGDEVRWREYTFRNGVRKALFILADSEVGKEDILNFYGKFGINEDRVKVLPFLPAPYLSAEISEQQLAQVKKKYDLPDQYLFYPAQFWPHKNHVRIIRALSLLKEQRNLRIPVVLCGSFAGALRKRTYDELISVAVKLGVRDQILHVGYVPDDDMGAFYAAACALVMPTFHGPTNIPVLEAWVFGCPVLTSDVRGIREQAGDAAVLVDPRSVESIADGICRLWTDFTLRSELSAAGARKLSSYTPADFANRLAGILQEARALATT